MLDGGKVRNQFLVRMLNKRNQPQHFTVAVTGGPVGLAATGAEAWRGSRPARRADAPIVVVVSRDQVQGSFPLEVKVASPNGRDMIKKTVAFVGPGY